MNSLGQVIASARRAKHKTLRALASECDVSPALLSMIEQGKHQSSPELIVKLAQILDGDADHWCAMTGRITPDSEAEWARLALEEPDIFRVFRTAITRQGGRK